VYYEIESKISPLRTFGPYIARYSFNEYRTTGDNLPDWKERIRDGQDATTSLVGARYYAKKRKKGLLHYELGPNAVAAMNHREGDLEWTPLATYTEDVALEERVLNEAKILFLRKALDITKEFQSGVFLGELREVLSMIVNPAKSFRKGIDDYVTDVRIKARKMAAGRKLSTLTLDPCRSKLKNGAYVQSCSHLQEMLADTWLEFSFGAQPLVSDIEHAMAALSRYNNKFHHKSKIVRAFAKEINEKRAKPVKRTVGYLYYYSQMGTKLEYMEIFRGSVLCEPVSRLGMAADLAGFTLSDFLPSVYELIPYSWLLDYFTNIGAIITAYSNQNLRLAWTNKTSVRKCSNYPVGVHLDQSRLKTMQTAGLVGAVTFAPHNWVSTYKLIERDSWGGGFIPTIGFQIPGFGLKWLNLAALATSRRLVPSTARI
jgi:hypothetical protein